MSENNQNQMGQRLSGLAEFSLKRPITITMIFLSLVTIGLISSQLLPLEQWPKIKTPQLRVIINYPSSTPKEVERNITRPLEEAFATIGGIRTMNSNSNTEGARIWMQFESDADIDEKSMLVQEQIDLTKPLLPDDLRRIRIRKDGMNDGEIMEIRITGDLDLENSYDVINKYLVQPIERVPGVAAVEFQGLEPKEIRIIIDNDALKKYGIGFNELSQKLREANFAIPSGNFKTGDNKGAQQLRVVPKGQMQDIEEFNNIVLNEYGVRLSDVAKLDIVNGDRNYARHLDRKYSVGMEIYNESTSNLVEVADRVLEKIEEISQTPQMSGIQLVFLRNQAESVRNSLNDVVMAGIIGALLSLIVLFLFIRDIATTLIVSLSIPISIAITLGALYFLDLSLNILSLMGLMLAIGMLVDNSVVVSESIFTRKTSGQFDLVTSIKKGVSDVMIPVIAGTMTSICVFLPIMVGQENMILTFLSHVAASIIAALIVSLFLSLTVVPLIISKMNKKQKVIDPEKSKFEKFKIKYASVLNFTLSHRWITFLFVILVGASGIIAAKFVNTDDTFSSGENRDFWMLYHVDGSFSLPRLKKDVDKVEDYLYANQDKFDIRTVYSYYEENGFVGTRIYLVDEDKASKPIADIKKEILEGLPKITIGKPNFRWGRGMGTNGVTVFMLGDSQDVMHEMLPDVLFELQSIEGVTGAQVEQRNQREEIQIEVNRERAIRLGLDPTVVAQSVNIAMRGLNLREVVTDMGEMPVIMRFYTTNEFKMEQLRQLPLKSANGNQVTLETVASIRNTQSPQSIRRNNRMGAVAIEVDLEDGVIQKQVREQIEKSMNKVNYPSGYSWAFDRNTRDRGDDAQAIIQIIFIAVALIFIVMAALFESLLFPLCVITCILFSYVGVLILFAFTGTPLSIMGYIGMLILIGVVVNNGIVLIDHINQLRISGMSRRDAVIQGGKDRIRPILMTVITTVVGLIPLALSMSTVGGEQGPAYFPMARAIIGGLTFSTIVSLLILPSLYVWLDDLRNWTSDRLRLMTFKSHRKPRKELDDKALDS